MGCRDPTHPNSMWYFHFMNFGTPGDTQTIANSFSLDFKKLLWHYRKDTDLCQQWPLPRCHIQEDTFFILVGNICHLSGLPGTEEERHLILEDFSLNRQKNFCKA